jgi:hypothetical protein
MAHVTVFITTYNREQFIGECVKSVLASAADDLTLTVFVLDNGSVDRTGEVAKKVDPSVQVVRNEVNEPVTEVYNQGLRLAFDLPETEYILQLNDDTALYPGALRKMIDVSADNPLSLVTPLQLRYDEPHNIDDGALVGVKGATALLDDALLQRPMAAAYEIDALVGAGLLAKKEVWQNIGFYDELCWFYGPDDDYCKRARWLGYKLLLVPDAHMLHAHGRFMTPGQEDPKAWIKRWRNKTQSRMLLKLKSPERPLCINYLRLTVRSVLDCFEHLGNLWVPGVFHTLGIYLTMVLKYPAFRRAYRRDYDPAKKVA